MYIALLVQVGELNSFDLTKFKKIDMEKLLQLRGFRPNKTILYSTCTPSKQTIPFL